MGLQHAIHVIQPLSQQQKITIQFILITNVFLLIFDRAGYHEPVQEKVLVTRQRFFQYDFVDMTT